MGESAESGNAVRNISRAEQDEFAARSHQRAALAQKNGTLNEEIVPILLEQPKGGPFEVHLDEGIQPETTVESLSRLRPALTENGTITAGSSSQISDGATAVVVMSKTRAEELGLAWLAENRRSRERRRAG